MGWVYPRTTFAADILALEKSGESKMSSAEYNIKDAGHLLRDFEALRQSSLYSQPRKNGRFGEPLGLQLLKASRKPDGMRFAEKRNFDEIDRSGFNGFIKKNFDEIDRSGFNSLVKKNFDEIDRSAFNGFVKRSADFESRNH